MVDLLVDHLLGLGLELLAVRAGEVLEHLDHDRGVLLAETDAVTEAGGLFGSAGLDIARDNARRCRGTGVDTRALPLDDARDRDDGERDDDGDADSKEVVAAPGRGRLPLPLGAQRLPTRLAGHPSP